MNEWIQNCVVLRIKSAIEMKTNLEAQKDFVFVPASES